MTRLTIAVLVLFTIFTSLANAETARLHQAPGLGDYDLPFYANDTYQSGVKSPDQFLGYALGAKPASHEEIVAYFEYLSGTFPNASLHTYGQSYEGRRLVYLVITSEENATRISDIQKDLAKISDPRKVDGDSEASKIIKKSPAVAWVAYGIHGDELSSCDAALQLAYQLLAGTDEDTELARDELITIIDPLQNPDGRTRWLTQLQQWNGAVPSRDVNSLQHRGLWPSGRTNHYLFDLNRDWFTVVHPETRGKTAAIMEWMPHYFLDCHEMGPTNTYLFSPPREPFNPYMVDYIHKWWKHVAEDQAKAFDTYGWSYYTREWNEEFFPGYGSSWAIYLGAVGMLFEQAGVDGSQVKRHEGTVMTYRETVHHQFIGSWSNLMTVASRREELLSDFYDVKLGNVKSGRGKTEAYIFPPAVNESRLERFAWTLAHQHIEVERATSAFKVSRSTSSRGEEVKNKTFPEGTLIVKANQPLRQLIDVILQSDIRIPTSFLVSEKKEILKHNRSKIYETTAWALPLAYDLEVYHTPSLPGVKAAPYSPTQPAGKLSGEDSPIGFVFDCSDDRSFRLLAKLLSNGYKIWSARHAFENGGKLYPRGSYQIRLNGNPDLDVTELSRWAQESGVDLAGIETSLGATYADLGGGEFALLTAPRIALVGGSSVSTSSFGAIWYLLDGRLNVRTSILELARLGRTDLDKYNVLVFPNNWGGAADYKKQLGKGGIDRLKKWVESGGTLVAIGTGAAFLADSSVALGSVRLKRQSLKKLSVYDAALEAAKDADFPQIDSASVWEGEPVTAKEEQKSEESVELALIKAADERARKLFPRGAILAADLDQEHWLTVGCNTSVPVMHRTNYAYLAAGGVQVPGRLSESKRLRIAGLLWPEARERWAETAYLSREAKGKGQIILFASGPTFRGYFHGTERLLLNALFLAPGYGTRRTIEW